MLLTAGACLGLDNVALGFVLGLVLAWFLRFESFAVERERITKDSGVRSQESDRHV